MNLSAIYYLKIGRKDLAEYYIEKVLNKSKKDIYINNAGIIYYEIGKKEEAGRLFMKFKGKKEYMQYILENKKLTGGR